MSALDAVLEPIRDRVEDADGEAVLPGKGLNTTQTDRKILMGIVDALMTDAKAPAASDGPQDAVPDLPHDAGHPGGVHERRAEAREMLVRYARSDNHAHRSYLLDQAVRRIFTSDETYSAWRAEMGRYGTPWAEGVAP